MTKEQLAAVLNGNAYGSEISKATARIAKESGLVVVYGASDDLMEFEGAIYDELGANDGRTAYVTPEGLLDECKDGCKYYEAAKASAVAIKAKWGERDISWQYETAIPHATFEIYEDGDLYCMGIVFALADVAKVQAARAGSGDNSDAARVD